MRGYAVGGFGEAPDIRQLPIPSDDDAILIRVRFAGVNPMDVKVVERLTATSTYPFVLGVDFAGVVERVPAGERQLHVGDRVFGEARTHGAYAEYTAVVPGTPGEPITRIPDGVADEQAAALPVAAIAALSSVELLGVTAGTRLAVLGATGGVGGYAVQMARSRGAHVIATVRGDADEARRLGAEEVYDTNSVDVLGALHSAHPDGIDAVLDLISGPDAIRADADVLRPGGSIVSANHAADEAWFAERQITAHNISGPRNPWSSPQGLDEVARLVAEGKITARIRATVELDGVGAVLGKLRDGGLRGKAVIRLEG
jgi:NADPH:quinone reductase-like Zn-dependent oxidoreductase